jgi:hypothetical protein
MRRMSLKADWDSDPSATSSARIGNRPQTSAQYEVQRRMQRPDQEGIERVEKTVEVHLCRLLVGSAPREGRAEEHTIQHDGAEGMLLGTYKIGSPPLQSDDRAHRRRSDRRRTRSHLLVRARDHRLHDLRDVTGYFRQEIGSRRCPRGTARASRLSGGNSVVKIQGPSQSRRHVLTRGSANMPR